MSQELLGVQLFDHTAAQPAGTYRSYSASGTDCERKVRNLLSEWPLAGDSRFGCYLIPDASPYSDLARVVECTVFREFFGNTPKVMADAYGPYEEHSRFFLVVDRQRLSPAGALRIIAQSHNGLKSLNDIEFGPLGISTDQVVDAHGIDDLDGCWDIGTLAVTKPYRGGATDHMVSMLLYGRFFAEARRRGIKHVVTILDKHAYAQLTELMGAPFVPIIGSQPFSYLGSDNSRACYGYVPDAVPTMEAHMRSLTPDAYQLLRPYLGRLLYCEGLPELVEVYESARTSTVRVARVVASDSTPVAALPVA